MSTEASAAVASVDPADFISNWEFFSDLFVPENHLEIPIKPEHKLVCDALQDAFLGELPEGIEYVIINIAPRVGKTKMIQSTACWAEAYFPDAQFIFTSYGADVAEESLAYIARTMREPWYIDLYGDHIHGKKADHVSTVEGGNLYAEGTGGALTSKGAGLKRPAGGMLVIDDASKPDEALSPTEARKKQQWVETTCKNRRNSDRWCPIVIIGQRLGSEDIPGYFLKHYRKKCLLIKIPTLIDPVTRTASNSDNAISAFEETVSAETLKDYRATRIGRFALATQYQQEDASIGGNLIPMDSFQRYDLSTARTTRWEKLVATVDTALKTKQANDFSALALWGLFQRRAYLIDLMHGKWESPELLANVAAFWEKYQSHEGWPRPRIIIEEKAAGTPLLQHLQRNGIPCSGIERDIDKVRRVKSVLPFIETGRAVIPKVGDPLAPWLEKWEAEHASFAPDGSAVHDDMVDTTVDGLEQLLGRLTIWDALRGAK